MARFASFVAAASLSLVAAACGGGASDRAGGQDAPASSEAGGQAYNGQAYEGPAYGGQAYDGGQQPPGGYAGGYGTPPQGWPQGPQGGGPQPTGDPVRDFQNGADPLTQAMNARLQQGVQQTLQDPAFQAAYQQRRAQGLQMTPEQFAVYWMETGGDTPEGRQRAFANQQQIAGQQAGQNADYFAHQEALRRQGLQNGQDQDWRSNESGRVMQGTQSVYDPQTGRCYAQAYTPAGEPYQGEVQCPPGYPQPR